MHVITRAMAAHQAEDKMLSCHKQYSVSFEIMLS